MLPERRVCRLHAWRIHSATCLDLPLILAVYSNPLQAQAQLGRHYNPHRWLQRRDSHIQECQIQRLGCRRTRQDTTVMETLLFRHPRIDLRNRLKRSIEDRRSKARVTQNHTRSRDEGGLAFSICKQTGYTRRYGFHILFKIVGGTDSLLAMRPQEVQERLKLDQLKDKIWYVVPSCATTGEGLFEGLVIVIRSLPFLIVADRGPGLAIKQCQNAASATNQIKLNLLPKICVFIR